MKTPGNITRTALIVTASVTMFIFSGCTAQTTAKNDSVARAYAARHEVTIDDAEHQMDLTNLAGLLEPLLHAKEPDRFAGLWLERKPEFKVVIAMTDGSVDPVQMIIQNANEDAPLDPLLDVVEVRRAGVSYWTLRQAQQKLREDAANRGITASQCYIDIRANRVIFLTKDLEDADATNEIPGLPDFALVEHDLDPHTDDHSSLDSGHALGNCTAGFVVKDMTSGAKRIATAGHCNNAQSYSHHTLQGHRTERSMVSVT